MFRKPSCSPISGFGRCNNDQVSTRCVQDSNAHKLSNVAKFVKGRSFHQHTNPEGQELSFSNHDS